MPRKRTPHHPDEPHPGHKALPDQETANQQEAANSTPARRRHRAAMHQDSRPGMAGASGEGDRSPRVQRAEQLVDRMTERVGHYAGVFGQKVLWLAAQAREQAEDIWAEAQAIRRGQGR